MTTNTDTDQVILRRNNLRTLIKDQYGTQVAFVRHIRGNQGEIAALLKPGGKAFGEKKARQLEEKAGIQSGWLDLSHRAETKPKQPRLVFSEKISAQMEEVAVPVEETPVPKIEAYTPTKNYLSASYVMKAFSVTEPNVILALNILLNLGKYQDYRAAIKEAIDYLREDL